MTTKNRSKSKSNKPTPEEKLVAELITLMESGKQPWRKEWDCTNGGNQQNILSHHIYTGQNPALLSFYQIARGYPLPLWAGGGQIKSKGWRIRKGSKACYICVPSMYQVDVENTFSEKVKESRIGSFYFSPIFNVKDIEGDDKNEVIARHQGEVEQPRPEPERMEKCEKLFAAYHRQERLETQWSGEKACYSPSLDLVTMPERKKFHSAHALYSTWAHELAHSTGHEKRLKRPMSGMYGLTNYAEEELVAELAAFLISHELQINSDTRNHANYLQSWIKCLHRDPSILKESLREANRAKNFILHPKEDKTKSQTKSN
jgi:antirestriction protein ArdC